MSKERPDMYVTVYKPVAGWKAVIMTLNEDGEYSPEQTGYYAYQRKEDAIMDAKLWSRDEDIPFFLDDRP